MIWPKDAVMLSSVLVTWKEDYMREKQMREMMGLADAKDFRRLKEALGQMQEADIAAFMEELDGEHIIVVFRMLPKETATEVFAFLPVETQQHIIGSITDAELERVIEDLFVDDAVDMLEELPANVVKRVLENAHPDTN